MSKEADNKAVVGRWFTDFWGKNCQSRGHRRDCRARHAAQIFAARTPPRP